MNNLLFRKFLATVPFIRLSTKDLGWKRKKKNLTLSPHASIHHKVFMQNYEIGSPDSAYLRLSGSEINNLQLPLQL